MSHGNLDLEILDPGLYAGNTLCVYEGQYDPDGSGPSPAENYRVYVREVRRQSSRISRSSVSRKRRFLVSNEEDSLKAEDGLLSCQLNVGVYAGVYLSNVTMTPGPSFQDWYFDCEYDERVPNVFEGHYSVSISTGGSSIIQTHALGENTFVAPSPATDIATDFGGAIDAHFAADGRLEIRGVERVIPTLDITIRARIANDFLRTDGTSGATAGGGGNIWAYADLISSMTGTVNDLPMLQVSAGPPATYAHQRGELLFLGANGDLIGDNPELEFRFAKSRNISQTNGNRLTIGDIVDIEKEGHHYLWIEHKTQEDSNSSRLTQGIRAVHVSQVYGYADHRWLGIGATPL